MILKSLELMDNSDHWLEACCVGDFESPTQLFIDVLFYRETLKPGVYTLAAEGKTFTFDLPQEGAQVTEQGFPGVVFNVQLQTKEE